ncbi:hypothetical protein IQ07DRAFT_583760 [Pyrenochaeta sp. DS3sAY3a]|nr:hypothetical protein IQ07DRAFT_583760 [Pyrenochaeta sp. DS3sAY3a]
MNTVIQKAREGSMSKKRYPTLLRLMIMRGTTSGPRLPLSRVAALLALVISFPQTQTGCSLHQFPYSPGDGSPQSCPSSASAMEHWDSSILKTSTCLILPSSYLRSVFKVYLESGSEAYQIYPSRYSNCLDGTSNHKFYTDDPTPQCFAWSGTGIAANDYLIFKCGSDSSNTIETLTSTHFTTATETASATPESFTTSVRVADPSSQSNTFTPKATESTSSDPIRGDGLKESDRITLGVGIGIGLPALIVALVTLYYTRGKIKPTVIRFERRIRNDTRQWL